MEYGSSVIVLPKDCLTAALRDAGEFNLKVLLTIAADESLRQDFDKCVASVCEQLDCTQTALEKAMKFWKNAGVMYIEDASSTPEPVVIVGVR